MMKYILFIIFSMIINFLLNKNLNFKINGNMMFLLFLLFLLNNKMIKWMNLYYIFGMDKLNFVMILLSVWICSLMFFCHNNYLNYKMYSFCVLMLLLILIISFYSMNYFIFYLFFEMSLIPMFIIIMGWGYQPERINASMYMLMYTLFASLPLMILIFYIFNYFFSLNYMIILNNFLIINMNNYLVYFFFIFAFLVKIPMFMIHFWLPKAHIEAPVVGSMALAGILLKLGGYGLIRSLSMMMNLSFKYNYIFFSISLVSILMVSILCLSFLDMKLIIAYSSIVHMGIMLLSILSMTFIGIKSSILMMLGHGLCSSGMFFIANLMYDRLNSRSLLINKGLSIYFPTMVIMWLLFCAGNMSFPFSMNFLSEIFMLFVVLNWSIKILLILMLGMYMSAIYTIILFSMSSFGESIMKIKLIKNISVLEYMIMLIHLVPLYIIFIKIDLLI